MAGCAIFRAGTEVAMAADALLVEGIRPFGNVLIALVTVTFSACFRRAAVIAFQVMVAVAAVDSVPWNRCVGSVVEQHVARYTPVHQSHGVVRFVDRKRRVTNDSHEQTVNRQSICQLTGLV